MKSFRLPVPEDSDVGSYFVNLDMVLSFKRKSNIISFYLGGTNYINAIYESDSEAVLAIKDIHKACSV